MKVSVDSSLCNGCGMCELICPEVFRMTGGDGTTRAVVRCDVVPEEATHFCRDARDCCKPRAIVLTGDKRRPRHRAPAVGSVE